METQDIKEEIIDIQAREGMRKLNATNAELKAKSDYIALEFEKLRNVYREPTQSPEQDKLLTALSKCISELHNLDLDRTGKGNRGGYTTLPDLTRFAMPILEKHGLSFRTEPIVVNDVDCLRSVLGHSSGQWHSSVHRLAIDYQSGKDVNQALGGALTYAKKHVMGTYFMLHTGDEK